jgi:hypothetical protein
MGWGRAVLAAVLGGALILLGAPSRAAASPTMRLSTARVAPGGPLTVTLSGWPEVTSVTICGNEAQRGAVDCDQVSGVAFPATTSGPVQRTVQVTVPPAPCPCVVRAATAAESAVQTVPITIVGAPSAPVVAAPAAAAAGVSVRARAVAADSSLLDRVRSSFGGPARRTLLLELKNLTAAPLTGISVSAAVGRDTQGGEPLQAPNVDVLEPGETRSYRVPVSLSAPSFGSYDIFGTIYGAGSPTTFTTTTSTTPWGLFVLVVLLLVDVSAMAYLRLARRRRQPTLQPEQFNGSTRETEGEQTLGRAPPMKRAGMVPSDALPDS